MKLASQHLTLDMSCHVCSIARDFIDSPNVAQIYLIITRK